MGVLLGTKKGVTEKALDKYAKAILRDRVQHFLIREFRNIPNVETLYKSVIQAIDDKLGMA